MIAFKPALGIATGDLQTLYPAFFAKPIKPTTTREIFELSDGDFVECLWHQKPNYHDKKPIVILFHGLAGSAHSPYMQRMMGALGQKGYAVVAMQFRGCGEKRNRLARSYHSGATEDAREWIAYLQERYHDSPLYAVGYSLGGNMLLKLLGEWGKDTPLKAAVAVSVPMQLESSLKRINQGFSKFYQWNMMRELKAQLKEKYNYHDIFALTGLKVEDVDKLVTFKEFDNAYTAPVHGFKDADDYYAKCSSKQFLKDISIPTLIIHAFNDPFIGDEVLPSEDELSKDVTFELYASGGHVGFVGGSIFKPKFWLEGRTISFFDTLKQTSQKASLSS
jgi:predicted alpha/beta-fold hydrolase